VLEPIWIKVKRYVGFDMMNDMVILEGY